MAYSREWQRVALVLSGHVVGPHVGRSPELFVKQAHFMYERNFYFQRTLILDMSLRASHLHIVSFKYL